MSNTLLNYEVLQKIINGTWLSKVDNFNEPLIGGAFDTRLLGNANIFFAWKGQQSDGHQYLNQLQNTSIKLIIVEHDVENLNHSIPLLKVDSSLRALHQIAHYLAQQFQGKIIRITGSSGKTTMKNWLSHILQQRYEVLYNDGTFNNEIGCPITLLNLEPHHEIIVLEMGSSAIGDLEQLTQIVPADISILLNVGHAHLGKFGNLKNTYQAKLEIFQHTKPTASAILPANDQKLSALPLQNTIFFGIESQNFYWDSLKVCLEDHSTSFNIQTPWGEKIIKVPTIGWHVPQLLSACLAAISHFQFNWNDFQLAIKNLPISSGRSKIQIGLNNVYLLNDTYNANPESVINMLKTISLLDIKHRVAVIGNLAELDQHLDECASYIANHIPDNINHIYVTGESGRSIVQAVKKIRPEILITYHNQLSAIVVELKSMANQDAIIGVKGSRSSHLERLVLMLQNQSCNCFLEKCSMLKSCTQCEFLHKS